MGDTLQEKIKLLKTRLAAFDRLAVAFSGNPDSSLLLLVANEVLGDNVLAMTATGPIFTPRGFLEAQEFCDIRGISQLVVNLPEETFFTFDDNPPNRCYLCKKGLYGHMLDCLEHVPLAEGTPLDGMTDAAGKQALTELGVISPLAESGFTRDDIKTALRAMNIKTAGLADTTCLATRIAYGEALLPDKLQAINELEEFIAQLGYIGIQVLHKDKIAILQISKEEMPFFCKPQTLAAVNKKGKDLGFLYVAIDTALSSR